MEKLRLLEIRADGMGVYETVGEGTCAARVVKALDLKYAQPHGVISCPPSYIKNICMQRRAGLST